MDFRHGVDWNQIENDFIDEDNLDGNDPSQLDARLAVLSLFMATCIIIRSIWIDSQLLHVFFSSLFASYLGASYAKNVFHFHRSAHKRQAVDHIFTRHGIGDGSYLRDILTLSALLILTIYKTICIR